MANLSTSFLIPVTAIYSSSLPFGFSALLDSGSSHCFLSPKILDKNMLPSTHLFPPCRLSMIDSSSSFVITEQITLDISFSNGDTHTITFYVAPLDSSCEAVLGLDWLVTYNPLIDWTTRLLTFHKAK